MVLSLYSLQSWTCCLWWLYSSLRTHTAEARGFWAVSIRHFGAAEHICAGSIIGREWVLTAAHCVDGLAPDALKIVAGTTKLTGGGLSHQVTEVVVHESYDSYYVKNDVALLKVSTIEFHPRLVAAISLDHEEIAAEVQCVLSGWGMTVYPGPVSDNLLYVNLTTAKTS
ncbi:trypsin-4-like [Photinus pyralis]|uniref:trypsin-4-like n=1 Tax=Photinus pyralis TaxID=7054 RepID=UPI00126774F8|nr:trypsin-4-like [Photinus pyralis]